MYILVPVGVGQQNTEPKLQHPISSDSAQTTPTPKLGVDECRHLSEQEGLRVREGHPILEGGGC